MLRSFQHLKDVLKHIKCFNEQLNDVLKHLKMFYQSIKDVSKHLKDVLVVLQCYEMI